MTFDGEEGGREKTCPSGIGKRRPDDLSFAVGVQAFEPDQILERRGQKGLRSKRRREVEDLLLSEDVRIRGGEVLPVGLDLDSSHVKPGYQRE